MVAQGFNPVIYCNKRLKQYATHFANIKFIPTFALKQKITSMLLYVSLFGIFLSLLLLYYNAKNYHNIIYLGIYFFLVSLYGVNQYVIMWSESVFWISIFQTNFTCFYYLIGPLSYLYIRSVLTDNSRLRKSDLLHFLPFLIYFLAATPHIFSSYAYKVQIAKLSIADPSFLGSYRFTILTDWLISAGVFISRPALVFAYAMVSGIQILHYFLSRRKPKPLTNEGFMKNWLITFLSFQLILIISHLSFIFNSFGVFGQFSANYNDLFNEISSVTLIGLIISPILFPQILYGLPNLLDSSYKPEKTVIDDSLHQMAKVKAKTFDEEYMRFIETKLEVAMKEHQIYLQKDFNLAQLSVLTQVPTHHLRYYFSNFKQQSFNDYRNEFRVRHAKLHLSQEQSGAITLEAIALLSGFSNRNTFSKAFKEIEGVTPSVYVAQIKITMGLNP